MTGMIFNIQRFSLQDGPGIRTTVFMKGCPLHCAWCHNPESQESQMEISYHPDKCLQCGFCVTSCPNQLHTIIQGKHQFQRSGCLRCGRCAEQCFSLALEKIGYAISSEEVIRQALADKAFYDKSGGGLTLSGGEPMVQPEFSIDIAQKAKAVGLHVCLETCGHCKTEELLKIAPFIDLFLYDYKLTDSNEHRKQTGVANTLILKNLKALDDLGTPVILRCPMIADVNLNHAHIDGIIDLAKTLKNIVEIHLEPYHPLGISKCEYIGKLPSYYNGSFLEKEALEPYRISIADKTGITVIIL